MGRQLVGHVLLDTCAVTSVDGGRVSGTLTINDHHLKAAKKPIPDPSLLIGNRKRIRFYRRRFLLSGALLMGAAVLNRDEADASELTEMEALKGKDYGKPKMSYSDFVQTDSGLQYKDLKPGSGTDVKDGDLVVIDWDGYTIGYYGRPFEARNKARGGAFTGDEKDFIKIRVGAHEVIPGFEEALYGMKPGGIRRIVVPLDLGYPNNSYKTIGPKPTTFSGKRTLSFVIENKGFIDKTLLFDIEVIKVVKS